MALVFKEFQSTLKNKNGENLWYPRVITIGKPVSTRKLASDIAQLSALTSGDVYNVLHNLALVMKTYLQESHSVKLDGIGSFMLRSRSGGNGVDTQDEVSASQIKSIVCHFTPETTLNPDGTVATRALVQGVSFVKLSTLVENETSTNDSEPGNEGDDGDNSGGTGTGNNPL